MKLAKQLFDWGIHPPDCKILVDAHDCGLEHGNLTFISNDEKLLEIINNHEPSFLKSLNSNLVLNLFI